MHMLKVVGLWNTIRVTLSYRDGENCFCRPWWWCVMAWAWPPSNWPGTFAKILIAPFLGSLCWSCVLENHQTNGHWLPACMGVMILVWRDSLGRMPLFIIKIIKKASFVLVNFYAFFCFCFMVLSVDLSTQRLWTPFLLKLVAGGSLQGKGWNPPGYTIWLTMNGSGVCIITWSVDCIYDNIPC